MAALDPPRRWPVIPGTAHLGLVVVGLVVLVTASVLGGHRVPEDPLERRRDAISWVHGAGSGWCLALGALALIEVLR